MAANFAKLPNCCGGQRRPVEPWKNICAGLNEYDLPQFWGMPSNAIYAFRFTGGLG